MKRKLLLRSGRPKEAGRAGGFGAFLFSKPGKVIFLVLCALFLVAGSGCLWVESMISKIQYVPLGDDVPVLSESMAASVTAELDDGESLESSAAEDNTPLMEFGTGDIQSDPDIQNILLIGADTWGNTYGRSDTMMVVSVNRKTNAVKMVSFLRDLYVKIDGYEDTRLNAAFAYGGARLLIDTLQNNFRFKIDNYVSIDFTSFEKTIDIIGGVQISLTQEEADAIYSDCGVQLSAGMNTLDGTTALSYARIRCIDSDFQRTGRQRKVISAVLSSLKQSSPVTLINLANSILPLMQTKLANSQILDRIYSAPSLLSGSMSQLAIPADDAYYSDKIRGMAVLVPDIEANKELVWKFLYDR